MPTDDEMFDVACNTLERVIEDLEYHAEMQDRRDNGASDMLREAKHKVSVVLLNNKLK